MLLITGVIGGYSKSVGETKFQTQMFLEKIMILQYSRKLPYVWHVLRGSGGRNAWVILERKIKRGKKAKGRQKRMWFDDITQWTMLKDYGEVKRSAEDSIACRAITNTI